MTEPKAVALVIEDEVAMRRFLRTALAAHGYEVHEAGTAAEGLALATQYPSDVVLLDLGLPDRDGMQVMEELRGWSSVPIIILSARGRDDAKVTALDAGADDYLTKPFSVNELLARVRVALRHAAGRSTPADPVIRLGPLALDAARHEVRVRGELVKLTPVEFRLLQFLAKHAGRVLTHRQILKTVWGPQAAHQRHYLRVYMSHLRKKIEVDPARPQLLLSEPGVGYRIADTEPESGV